MGVASADICRPSDPVQFLIVFNNGVLSMNTFPSNTKGNCPIAVKAIFICRRSRQRDSILGFSYALETANRPIPTTRERSKAGANLSRVLPPVRCATKSDSRASGSNIPLLETQPTPTKSKKSIGIGWIVCQKFSALLWKDTFFIAANLIKTTRTSSENSRSCGDGLAGIVER